MSSQTPDKTVVITGSSSGLGFECARALLQTDPPWHVIVTSRSENRASAAAQRLPSDGVGRATPLELDLSSLDSVRKFVQTLVDRIDSGEIPPLSAVVCNAGIQYRGRTDYTDDGFEATIGVNHLSHFLLVNLLLEHIHLPGRVIFTASGVHDPDAIPASIILGIAPAPLRLDNITEMAYADESPGSDSSYSGMKRYSRSKLANILTAYELDRRLQSSGISQPDAPITSNAFDPGLMPGTGLARDYNPLLRFIWNNVLTLSMFRVVPFVSSQKQSGRDLANLVTDPELADVSGRYFVKRESVNSSRTSYDEELANKLWEESSELVGLSDEPELNRHASVK